MIRASKRAAAAAVVLWLAVAAGAPARAALVATLATAVGHMAIVAPNLEDPVIAEAVSRLRSELSVVGVDSEVVDCTWAGAVDTRACTASRGPATDADAASRPPLPQRSGVTGALISLAREDGVVTIEVIERLADGRKFFRLVYVPSRDGGEDPAVLAVRGVELLRDLHMDVERSEVAPKIVALPPPVVVVSPAAPARPPGPWRITATAGLLQGRDGLGPRVAPALGVARVLSRHLSATLLASGPYFQDLTWSADPLEHASTRQELALVGIRYALDTRYVRPFGAASVGVLHMAAQGYSQYPSYVTRGASLWAGLASAGVGAAWGLNRFFELVAEADLLVAAPAGQVTIQDTVVGTAGAPSALFQLGLWAALP